MSDFKAKMYQIVCRLGLRPRLRWGSLQRSPDPLAGFRGPISKGRGRDEKEGEGRKEQKGEGAGSAPKLKLGPQNYFSGTGAVEIVYWTSN